MNSSQIRFYRHRVNTVRELGELDPDLGIEFDLRDDGTRVIVAHDPFVPGPTLDEFFPAIGGRPCIFNVKSEGIEEYVLEAARIHGIQDFFFLDLTVPAAMKLAQSGEDRLAVRYSEVEPVEAVLAWRGKARWVWVDCFTRWPLDESAWSRIRESFRICLVSPELQRHGEEAVRAFRSDLGARRYDAVCTKAPGLWGWE